MHAASNFESAAYIFLPESFRRDGVMRMNTNEAKPYGLSSRLPRPKSLRVLALGMLGAILLSACGSSDDPPPMLSKVEQGKEVFRFETFGNQGFWTDAMGLPQGIAEARVTPLQALSLGLNVDVEALSPGTARALTDALEQIRRGTDPAQTVLADPAVTLTLINEGAVIGVVPFDRDGKRKPLGSAANFNPNDRLDIGRGDKVGISCALCHSRTDNSVVPAGFARLPGSVGKRVDGPNAIDLDIGAILATARNPQAYLPLLQLKFASLNGASIGKTEFGGIQNDTVAEVRAYLTGSDSEGERHYGPGTFDALPDGINNTSYTQSFFRTDLAAPWGHAGIFDKLDDFNNYVYTVALDPTILATEAGRGLLSALAGPVGEEIHTRYRKVLRDLGLEGRYPFVKAGPSGRPIGDLTGVAGVRVDNAKLEALRAYTDQLEPPAPPSNLLAERIAQGKASFDRTCASCHTADPKLPVRNEVIPMLTNYPAYNPTVILQRPAPLSPVQKSFDMGPNPAYDNEVVVLNASLRGAPVGYALPLLLGIEGRKDFLHDGSVEGSSTVDALRKLFDPARGPNAPHPFYLADTAERDALIDYLRSRHTR
jgi:cytochrome c2